MRKKEVLKVYKFKYASTMYGDRFDEKYGTVFSDKTLKEKDTIIIEKVNVGVFIGEIVEDITEYSPMKIRTKEELINDIGYVCLKKVDISEFVERQNNRIRKKELQKLMERKFEELDKEMKYKFYAENNDEMKELYDEYINL